MPTDLQLTANRRNSQNSTGPRSVTGKVTSSQNAFKTGIYSESEIVRGENAADLDALTAAYYSRFQPQLPEESCLVDILVHSEWILRRLRRAEAELCELYTQQTDEDSDPGQLEFARAFDFGRSVVLIRLQRRVDSTQRNYLRALKELKQLQSDRPAAQPAAKIDPQSETAPIGFVPSPLPEPAAIRLHPQPVVPGSVRISHSATPPDALVLRPNSPLPPSC